MDGFKINKKFAEHYDKYRRAEELQKLKDKYGKDGEESDSSSESEDDMAEAVNPKLEKDFFRVLAQVKAKDPMVYRKDAKFYDDLTDSSSEVGNNNSEQTEKPLYMREYVNKLMSENGRALDDENYDGKVPDDPDSYYGKLAAIKKSFTQAADECDEKFTNDDGVDSLMTMKPTKQNSETSGVDKDDDDDDDKDDGRTKLEELDDYWKDPKLDEKEKYLRDFILNKKYLESESDDDEQFRHKDKNGIGKEEEDFNEKQELFEYKFNTRFEHPDREFLKSFPRVIATSVRRKDDGKKKRRQRREKRKAEEKQKKVEELARLKRLKREEILDKINRLRTATGNTDVDFSSNDIDGDFDPDDHDKRMKELFNDEFYSHVEEEKPEFSDMEDEELGEDSYKKQFDEFGYEQNVPECERDDFVMDCDYVPAKKKSKLQTNSMKNGNKSKRNKKLIEEDKLERAARLNLNEASSFNDVIGADYVDDAPECEQDDFVMDCDYEAEPKSKRQLKKERAGLSERQFEDMLQQRAAAADDKSVSEHLREYYAMEFDDLIGDMPCRFKYKEVQPNNYGLSTTDILLADDATLNMWCPLKRVVAHRLKEEESYLKQKYKKKAGGKKKKVLFSKFYDKIRDKKKVSTKLAEKEEPKEVENDEEPAEFAIGEKQIENTEVQNVNNIKQNETKDLQSSQKTRNNKKTTQTKIGKKHSKSESAKMQTGTEKNSTQIKNKKNQTQSKSKNNYVQNQIQNKKKQNKTQSKIIEKGKNQNKNLDNLTHKKKVTSTIEQGKHKNKLKKKKYKKPTNSNKSSTLHGLNKTRLAAYGLASEKYLSKKYYSNHLDGINKN